MKKGEISITKKDLQRAEAIKQLEAIDPFNLDNMFKQAVLYVLMGSHRYGQALWHHQQLLAQGFDHPQAFLVDPESTALALGRTRFPSRYFERLTDLSIWWKNSSIPQQILTDAQNGHNHGSELRAAILKRPPKNGMGAKTASLLLANCGYEETVPLDRHMCRLLIERGINIPLPDDHKKGGLTKAEYKVAEPPFIEWARAHDLAPTFFQRIMLGKVINRRIDSAWAIYGPKPTSPGGGV